MQTAGKKVIEPGKYYVEFDKKGEVTKAVYEDSFRRLLGYGTEAEYANTQESWVNSVHPDDFERVAKYFAEVVKKHPEGLDYDIELRMLTKTGYRWFHDYAVFTRRKDGSPLRAQGVVFDIQETMDSYARAKQTQAMQKILQENNARMLALQDDFESLYDVDLETGAYETFIKDLTFFNALETKLVENQEFFEDSMKNIDAIVYAEDREAFKRVINRDYIRKALEKDNHFDWHYRLFVGEKPVWFRMRVVYKDKEKRRVIIGLFNAEKEMAEQAKNERLAEQNIFNSYFLKGYISAYYVDLADLGFKVYKQRAELDDKYIVIPNYIDSLGKYISYEVHPEDREKLRVLLQPQKLKQMLAEQPELFIIYRKITDGAEGVCQATVIRGADENHAVFGFRDITNEVREQQERIKSEGIIAGFARNYEAAFLGNLKNRSFQVLSDKENIVDDNTDLNSFGEALKNYVEKSVHPADRKNFREELFYKEKAIEVLSVGKQISFEYRSNTSGEYLWYRAVFSRLSDEEVLVGFKNCNDEINSRVLEEKLLGKYDAVYSVDLNNDEIRPIRSSRVSKVGAFDKTLKYNETVKKFADTVAPKYKQDWLNFSNPDYMKKFMADEDQREYIYELPETAQSLRRFTVDVLERFNGEAAVLLFSFVGIDDLQAQAMRLQEKMAEQSVLLEKSLTAVRREKNRFEVVKEIMNAAEWSMQFDADGKFIDTEFSKDIDRVVDNDMANSPFEWYKIVHPDDLQEANDAFYAAIADRSCRTPYDVNFRMLDRHGKYNWFHVAGRVVREADGSGEFFGIHININDRMKEEQKRLLGTVKLSLDVLNKANIGFWSFELDEGKPPRMYVDDTMLGLIGLDHQVPPEETYHAWYDHIDKDSYGLVTDAVEKMSSGEHAEVQYPWHHPDGHTMVVRCGGIRNFEYTAGIRIEGTHQNVSEVLHYDEEEAARLRQAEIELQHEQLRSEVLSFMMDNDDDPIELLKNYAERLRMLISCDQVIYRDLEETRIMVNSPAIEKTWSVPIEYCRQCRHFDAHHPMYKDGYTEMANCQEGWQGIPVYEKCPIKSSLTRIVYCDNEVAGYLAIHYVQDYHQFTDLERGTVEEFTRILSISLSRYAARKENKELKLIAEMQEELKAALDSANAEAQRNDFLYAIMNANKWSYEINEAGEITGAAYSEGVYQQVRVDLAPPGPMRWIEYLHPEDKERVVGEFMAVINDSSGQTKYDSTFRIIGGDGKERWTKSAGRIMRRSDGTREFFGMTVDLTEQIEKERAQQEQLKESLAFTNYFLGTYVSAYYVGLDDESCQIYKRTDELEQYYPIVTNFVDSVNEYIGRDVHPEDRDGLRRIINPANMKAALKASPEIVHNFRDISDGVEKIYKFQAIRGADEAHAAFGFKNVTEEVAAEQKRQRELEESLAFTNYFLSTYESVYYMNLTDLTCQVYKRTEKIAEEYPFTGSYMNITSDYIERVIHPEDREKMREIMDPDYLRKTLKEKPEIIYVFRDTLTFGEEQFVRFQAIRGADENHIAFGFKNVTDEVLTEQKRQRELEEALSMAQAANRAKTTFLNNMSHDIRTPMNAIIGFTGLAASHIDNKERIQDYLSKIGQSSAHLLSLINDVLDMSRIESGKMNIDEKEENLSDIIHTLRDIVQASVHAKQHDFFIDTVNVNDENIICDKLRLNQVLLNILSNSIKYTAQGGTISMRITEKTVKSSGYATYEFRIKDNGMGMDKEFIKTLFDPFTRVKSSTVSGIQGTGLGMAITKNIVDMMGGKIEVESELCKGTTMTVTFDFKLQSTPKAPAEIPELKGVRGLVVDDDANTCLSICNMLEDIGMRDEWCTTGKEAVFRAEAAYRKGDSFKVYIIDWLMPDMNGIETTRRIRKVIGNEAPIIILTAYDWTAVEDEAREAGVTAFISKPLFPSDLNRVLNRCLGKAEQPVAFEADGPDFHGKKVLLVEDNELNLEIASELLTEYGFVIDTAEDGHLAVEKMKAASAGDYDLVLMDVQMPTMDGYEATRQIRALGTEISKIPILAMTANAFEEDRKKAIEAGMNDHIAKPIDINMLKETLAKFL